MEAHFFLVHRFSFVIFLAFPVSLPCCYFYSFLPLVLRLFLCVRTTKNLIISRYQLLKNWLCLRFFLGGVCFFSFQFSCLGPFFLLLISDPSAGGYMCGCPGEQRHERKTCRLRFAHACLPWLLFLFYFQLKLELSVSL